MTIHLVLEQKFSQEDNILQRRDWRADRQGTTFGEPMLSNDLHTWNQVIAGDRMALKAIFHAYYTPLCRFAAQWTADGDEAEEIVQKMFVDLWEKRAELHIALSLKSYMYASVRNRCLNFVKHKKVVRMHQHMVQNQPITHHEISELDEVTNALNKAMNTLPEQCQRVFRMVKIDGKRYAEVAEELDISIKTIENHMTKALRILRSELHDYMPLVLWSLLVLPNY